MEKRIINFVDRIYECLSVLDNLIYSVQTGGKKRPSGFVWIDNRRRIIYGALWMTKGKDKNKFVGYIRKGSGYKKVRTKEIESLLEVS